MGWLRIFTCRWLFGPEGCCRCWYRIYTTVSHFCHSPSSDHLQRHLYAQRCTSDGTVLFCSKFGQDPSRPLLTYSTICNIPVKIIPLLAAYRSNLRALGHISDILIFFWIVFADDWSALSVYSWKPEVLWSFHVTQYALFCIFIDTYPDRQWTRT